MKPAKRKRLERAGWCVGSAENFLGLSEEEQSLVERKLALANAVKRHREKRHLSQSTWAARMRSSQSSVAKIEAGDPSVSLELLVRAVLATGAIEEGNCQGTFSGITMKVTLTYLPANAA